MARKEWTNGPHLLAFEEPDIFHCYVRGPVLLHEAKETMRVIEQEVLPNMGKEKIFFVSYLEDDGGFPAETRKYFGSFTPPWKGMLMVGGSPMMRAASNVVMRAMSLLSPTRIPTKMVKTEADARAAMAEMRVSLAKDAAS